MGSVVVNSLNAHLAELDEELENLEEKCRENRRRAIEAHACYQEAEKEVSKTCRELNEKLMLNIDMLTRISLLEKKTELKDWEIVLLRKELELANQEKFLPDQGFLLSSIAPA